MVPSDISALRAIKIYYQTQIDFFEVPIDYRQTFKKFHSSEEWHSYVPQTFLNSS